MGRESESLFYCFLMMSSIERRDEALLLLNWEGVEGEGSLLFFPSGRSYEHEKKRSKESRRLFLMEVRRPPRGA